MTSIGSGGSGGFLSQQNAPSERRSLLPWVLAGAAILIGLLFLLFSGRRHPEPAADTAQTPDAYASQLAIRGVEMSEAANFAGGKVTYVDGQITNNGDKTVTAVHVIVTFRNDAGQPPEEVPMVLSLIRTREPYIDIEPVSAEPLKPGASHEFRLIFDQVPAGWNLQPPEIHPVRVQSR